MVCPCYNNHRNDEICGCICHDYEDYERCDYGFNSQTGLRFSIYLEAYHNGS